MKIKTSAVIACTATVLFMAQSATASGAWEPDPNAPPTAGLTTKIPPPAASKNAAAGVPTAIKLSPSGCVGKSNNPHKSTTPATRGFIKGYSSTRCKLVVPMVKIRATVWRSRWFGYEQMGQAGVGTERGTGVGRSGIWNSCDTTVWRTVGQHTALDRDGRTYSAETMKYEPIAC